MKIERNLLLEWDWRIKKLIGEVKKLIQEDMARIYSIVKETDSLRFEQERKLLEKK